MNIGQPTDILSLRVTGKTISDELVHTWIECTRGCGKTWALSPSKPDDEPTKYDLLADGCAMTSALKHARQPACNMRALDCRVSLPW